MNAGIPQIPYAWSLDLIQASLINDLYRDMNTDAGPAGVSHFIGSVAPDGERESSIKVHMLKLMASLLPRKLGRNILPDR